MSHYLVDRVRRKSNIEVRLRTEVVRGGGVGHLERLLLADLATGEEEEVAANWLYVFIGAQPRTDWVGDAVARDQRGFILTGPDVAANDRTGPRWPLRRAPLLLETSRPGVFAAGDVRLVSMKRVASAVGEGSSAVSNVALDALRQQVEAARPAGAGALATMDREDAIGSWLGAREIDDAEGLASTLAGAGAEPSWLAAVERAVGPDHVGPALRWIATAVETRGLVTELLDSTGRVSRLVDDARAYSQMDRAPLQTVDVHDGIESTLQMLANSFGEVRVEREFTADVPVDAFASEINQVWTNLIVNAVDAMDGRGVLRVATRRDGNSVVVEFTDSGPGMKPDVLARVFEPFFWGRSPRTARSVVGPHTWW